MRRWSRLVVSAVVLGCGGGGERAPDASPNGPDGGGSAIDGAGGGADGGSSLPWLAGTNLSGGEFGALPGSFGTTYTYPRADEVDYFVGKGMNVIRIPFRWERLQPSLMQPLDPTELGRLDPLVQHVVATGAWAILDPHNYARYDEMVVGSGSLANEALADFWGRLAGEYAGLSHVIFGLMNEPNGMPTEQWLGAANAAISGIRAAGATNLILVPGNGYTGAWTWESSWYGTANATVMTGVVDPMDHWAYEVHQYFDGDGSGTSDACVSPTVGAERIAAFTTWLHDRGGRALLGEFGAGRNDPCTQAVDGLLDVMDANRDVWLGFTWWSAGSWWGDYMFTISPDASGVDRPQLGVLLEHL